MNTILIRSVFSGALTGFVLLAAGCGENVSSGDLSPPAAPVFVPRSPDDVYAQTGIRPEPVDLDRNYWVRIEWYANSEPDVLDGGGYRIWRMWEGDTLQRAHVVADLRYGVDLDLEDRHYWTDHGLNSLGEQTRELAPDSVTGDSRGFFWFMQALDTDGNKSVSSDTIYFRLINNPFDLTIMREAADQYRMSWSYDPSSVLEISYYYIRIYEESGGPDAKMWDFITRQYGSQAIVYLNEDGEAGNFERGTNYVWQLNVVSDREIEGHAGNDAGAAVFTIFEYYN